MLSKLAFLLQKSSDDYWVIWLKATCLSWRPGEYLSWRTGEHLYVLYLSLVKLFPTLPFFSHFCIMIIERGFADLSIESSFNIQISVSPSSQLGRLCEVRFPTHVIKSWRHNKRLSSGMMMMMMKMKYSSKSCHPSSLVSGMPHENVFFCVFYQE